MPTENECVEYQHVIYDKYQSLNRVFATADGLKLYLEQSGDAVIENMFYNGWKSNHLITNVLLFVSDRYVIAEI